MAYQLPGERDQAYKVSRSENFDKRLEDVINTWQPVKPDLINTYNSLSPGVRQFNDLTTVHNDPEFNKEDDLYAEVATPQTAALHKVAETKHDYLKDAMNMGSSILKYGQDVLSDPKKRAEALHAGLEFSKGLIPSQDLYKKNKDDAAYQWGRVARGFAVQAVPMYVGGAMSAIAAAVVSGVPSGGTLSLPAAVAAGGLGASSGAALGEITNNALNSWEEGEALNDKMNSGKEWGGIAARSAVFGLTGGASRLVKPTATAIQYGLSAFGMVGAGAASSAVEGYKYTGGQAAQDAALGVLFHAGGEAAAHLLKGKPAPKQNPDLVLSDSLAMSKIENPGNMSMAKTEHNVFTDSPTIDITPQAAAPKQIGTPAVGTLGLPAPKPAPEPSVKMSIPDFTPEGQQSLLPKLHEREDFQLSMIEDSPNPLRTPTGRSPEELSRMATELGKVDPELVPLPDQDLHNIGKGLEGKKKLRKEEIVKQMDADQKAADSIPTEKEGKTTKKKPRKVTPEEIEANLGKDEKIKEIDDQLGRVNQEKRNREITKQLQEEEAISKQSEFFNNNPMHKSISKINMDHINTLKQIKRDSTDLTSGAVVTKGLRNLEVLRKKSPQEIKEFIKETEASGNDDQWVESIREEILNGKDPHSVVDRGIGEYKARKSYLDQKMANVNEIAVLPTPEDAKALKNLKNDIDALYNMRKVDANEFTKVTDIIGSNEMDSQKAYNLRMTLKTINDAIYLNKKTKGSRESLAALYQKKYTVESALKFATNAFEDKRIIYDFSTDGELFLSDHLAKMSDVLRVTKRPDGYLEVGFQDFDPNAKKISLSESRVTKIKNMHRTELAVLANELYTNPHKDIRVVHNEVSSEIGSNPLISDGLPSLNTEHLMKSETGRDILEMAGRLKDREKMAKVVPTKESAAPNDMTYGTPNLKPLNKHTDYWTPVNGSAMDFQHYPPANKSGIGIEGLNPFREHVVRAEAIDTYVETLLGKRKPAYDEFIQNTKEVTGIDLEHGTIGNPTHLDVRGC